MGSPSKSIVILMLFGVLSSACSSGVDGKKKGGSSSTGGDKDTDFTGGANPLPLVTCSDLGPQPGTLNPILFVTQVPIPADFGHLPSTFGTQRSTPISAGRGGDLYILYPDQTVRNLTREAGYGNLDGAQTSNSIAVRDPAVHWCGKKALFSMVIGAPVSQNSHPGKWQIYEVSGLEKGATVNIAKVPHQPAGYNNIYPIYDSYGRIIFASDQPHLGSQYTHLYPQRDEYEMTPTNTGLWSLDPRDGKIFLMDHSPSGNFKPIIDSFGRVVFTRWDHAIRDDHAVSDNVNIFLGSTYGNSNMRGAFNFNGEHAGSRPLLPITNAEVFPEPNSGWLFFVNQYIQNNGSYPGPLHGWESNLAGVSEELNNFLPWMMRQDGRQMETLNHVGRHELFGNARRVFNNDSDLVTINNFPSGVNNTRKVSSMHQIREHPTQPGVYFGINAPEFGTHAAGQIFSLTGGPSLNGNQMVVTHQTHTDTARTCHNLANCPNHTGFYRSPLMLTNGLMVAVNTHTGNLGSDFDTDSSPNGDNEEFPGSTYKFRLKLLQRQGDFYVPLRTLTPGFTRTLSYWYEDAHVNYNNVEMWEFDPVEVVSRPVPAESPLVYENPEIQAARDANISASSLVRFLKNNDLALVIMRNVTVRDANDHQQPFNLEVADSAVQTVNPNSSRANSPYRVEFLQLIENKLIRGQGIDASANFWQPGRRGIGQPMDTGIEYNLPSNGPLGTVKIDKEDGSLAAIVPAQKAMSWELTNSQDKAIVRERFWVTFQPGEVRVCANCHGLNEKDQAGHTVPPANTPKAAIKLFEYLKNDLKVIE